MTEHLHCVQCSKYMGELRDAKIRKGMVIYCEGCDKQNKLAMAYLEKKRSSDVPEFLRGLGKRFK